jgi:PAS domain S-box-containing protein
MGPSQPEIETDVAARTLPGAENREAMERFLAAIVESSDDAIISKNLEGIITSWNRSAERLFGYTAREIVGKSIRTIIPPELNDEETRILERVGRGEKIDHYETIRVAKDGTRLEVSLTVSPVRNASGQIIGASKVLRNLTERNLAERRLAEQSRLLNLSFDAILVCDLKHRISFWNKGCEELYGWSESEALGKVSHSLLHTTFAVSLEETEKALQKEGRWQGELVQKTKDNRTLITVARWALDRDPKGEPVAILKTHNDITARKQAEEELKRANTRLSRRAADLEKAVAERTAHLQKTIAELETFSYSLSHDMRAPLRTIHGFAEILLSDLKDRLDESDMDLLHRMQQAASRLDRLILDVLTYSRVSQEKLELRPVDLAQLLRQILRERPEFQSPRAAIKIEPPLYAVRAHEAYLSQCLTNLLDNALKFVAPGTTPIVHIHSEIAGDQVRLCLADNGIGIPTDSRERIFGIFQRLHGQDAYPGTGIGLAIVRKAMERMGGTVEVESKVGQGSRFWLQLPKA